MRTVRQYLRHAEECEALAATATSDEQRQMIAQMAETWRLLAAQRRKKLDGQAAGEDEPQKPTAAGTAESPGGVLFAADAEDNLVYSIRLEPRDRWIHVEWKRYATSDQIRCALETVLTLLKANGITKILGDDSCLETISSDDQTWIIENWIPRARAAGLRTMASKKSGSFFTRRAVNIIHTAAAEAVETRIFAELDDARTWLRRS